jgi:hypothetical protein
MFVRIDNDTFIVEIIEFAGLFLGNFYAGKEDFKYKC